MPELPEVENIRRALQASILGLHVIGVTLHRRDVVSGPNRKHDLLLGRRIARILRHGKQLAIVSEQLRGVRGHRSTPPAAEDGPALCVHLGMSGQLLFKAPGERCERTDHVHLAWRLADEEGRPRGRLIFRDPRRFGGVWAFPSLQALRTRRWASLGPDALAVDPALVPWRPPLTRRPIKAVLLDQRVLAGVGNIYADESLFRARLSPLRPAAALEPEELDRLHEAIRAVLLEAVAAGGSTLRDYVSADGAAGRFQLVHRVYGRAGQRCFACGEALKTATIAQRTSVWCPACQR